MEKKNTILLTVIAVATLLVAVVGATFAYFTATTQTGDGTGTTATQTTVNTGGTSLDMSAVADVTNAADMKYPGGMMVTASKVSATATGDNSYNMTYTVNAEVDTTALGASTSEVKWTLYEVGSEVKDLMVADSCQLKEDATGNSKNYYYTGCTANTTITNGTVVKSGTISAHTAKTTITAENENLDAVSKTAGKDTWYYLVVEYVNKTDADQAGTDAGKTITAKITSVTDGKAAIVK